MTNNKNSETTLSAARLTASVFGVLCGLGGMTHGVGEILQGNVAPDGMFINSWTQGPIATNLGGEPGMTIIPNLLVTGILNIIVALAVIVWAAAFVQRERGGLILILLSIALLLVGGGFAPPIIGVLSGIAGLGINSPHTWWREHVAVNVRQALAQLWIWVFAVAVINGVFLVIGSVVLVTFFGLNQPDWFVNSFLFGVVLMLVLIPTGIAYDIQNSDRIVVRNQGRLAAS